MSYITRKIRLASERNRQRANRRWDLDRARRDALARIDPVYLGGILRRIIVIERETVAREVVIFESDSRRSTRAKLRAVGL